jgi:glucan endo-1,3-beta-D-glucosidase
MQFFTSVVALTATLSTAYAQNDYKGFGTGTTFNDGTTKQQNDYAYEMRAAQQLPRTRGAFTSMRIYTMIQGGTTDTPISAIPAAIETNTTLLLGLGATLPPDAFNREISALKNAINQYGMAFADLVTGISVGNEDLYRTSINVYGATPAQLLDYIARTRSAVAGTLLAGKPVGHADRWDVLTSDANNAVVSAVDFVGLNAYPYYQSKADNRIQNANTTFWKQYTDTVAKAQGKPVWVTETGWPVLGATNGQAVPSVKNARIYWKETACSLMAAGINMYYWNLQTAQNGNPLPDWGVKGSNNVVTTPARYSVTCPDYNVFK